MLSRRQFLGHAAHTAVAALGAEVAAALLSSACSTGSGTVTSSTNAALPCDGAGAESSIDQGHSHAICISLAAIEGPPAAGATFTTTRVSGHTHDLALAQTQLQALEAGQTVTMTTTNVDNHTHLFVLQRATPNAATPSGRG
jgi:hypothetical protein